MLKKTFGMLALTSAILAPVPPAVADWVMEPERSSMSFVTIKSKDIAEINTFQAMRGRVDDQGRVSLDLMLDSVETLIPVRNERMRELLFKTSDYQQATITAKVDPVVIESMQVGEIGQLVGEAALSLHGRTQPMTMHLRVAKVAPGVLLVASEKPLVVDAEQFGLGEGVEKLREIAGLESISHAVPVSFVLTFVEEPASDEPASEEPTAGEVTTTDQ